MSETPASTKNPREARDRRDAILKHFPTEKFESHCRKLFRGISYYDVLGESGISSLKRYIYEGCPPGDFLSAVFANNLSESFGRADDRNQSILQWWIAFIYNSFPIRAWGSKAAVTEWIKLHQDCRDEEEAEVNLP